MIIKEGIIKFSMIIKLRYDIKHKNFQQIKKQLLN